ncbi:MULTISPECIES: hypothetical protein [Cupriavidus]
MMNAQDALGLQEDLAIMRNLAGEPRRAPVAPPDENGNVVAALAIGMKARNNTIADLRQQLNSKASERNEVAVLAKAARETVDLLARELARQSGMTEQECLQLAKEALSRRYDAILDQAIADRQVLRDIRRVPEEIQKCRWYSPAP